MNRFVRSVALVALLVGVAGISTPSRAEVGQVAVIFTKGGFIIGVGGGEGVLVLRGKRYPFTVSGMSVGFTIGASTTKFVGRALNLKGPASIEGSYAVIGAGGAVAAGAGCAAATAIFLGGTAGPGVAIVAGAFGLCTGTSMVLGTIARRRRTP